MVRRWRNRVALGSELGPARRGLESSWLAKVARFAELGSGLCFRECGVGISWLAKLGYSQPFRNGGERVAVPRFAELGLSPCFRECGVEISWLAKVQVRRTGRWSVFSGMRAGDFVAGEPPQVRRTGIESVFVPARPPQTRGHEAGVSSGCGSGSKRRRSLSISPSFFVFSSE